MTAISSTYVSVLTPDSLAHLSRHFQGSREAGSKFLPQTEDEQQRLLERVDELLASEHARQLARGVAPGRAVLSLSYDRPIGRDAITALDPSQPGQLIRRDAGTPLEVKVQAIETAPEQIPLTNLVTIIAGPYGPSGKRGIYTLFPGQEAPAFPSERQTPEARAESEGYWKTHGFLATSQEVKFAQENAVKQDLAAVSPDLASIMDRPDSATKWVLAIEACNWAAKLARDRFKALRSEGKTTEAKQFDMISGNLMGAAKNRLLPLALQAGAEAFASKDDAGQSVILLCEPTAGVIGLHGVNLEKLPAEISRHIKTEGAPVHTGFRRQRLSEHMATLVANGDKDVLSYVAAASRDARFAGVVFNELGGKEKAQEAPAPEVIAALRRAASANTLK